MTGTAANAGALTHKLSSSVQLTVDAAATRAVRIGSSYSVSGNGVSTTDGTNAGAVGGLGSISSGLGSPANITATQATSGNSFSFNQSYLEGDALSGSAPTVGAVANYSALPSTTAGAAGSLAGTNDPAAAIRVTAGASSVTAGGAGSSAVGQFVSEISIFD